MHRILCIVFCASLLCIQVHLPSVMQGNRFRATCVVRLSASSWRHAGYSVLCIQVHPPGVMRGIQFRTTRIVHPSAVSRGYAGSSSSHHIALFQTRERHHCHLVVRPVERSRCALPLLRHLFVRCSHCTLMHGSDKPIKIPCNSPVGTLGLMISSK